MIVTLYAVPAPGQRIRGDDRFLGTVRTHMHKAPFTALAAQLSDRLQRLGVRLDLRIVDMQMLGGESEAYGDLDFGGLSLEKHRVGLSFERVRDQLKEDDIVGINANFTHSRKIETDFAKFAKSVNPKALIVFGGTDATHEPEYFLRNGADVVVKGEAESTFEDLIVAVRERRDLGTVPNIAYQRDGTLQETPKTFLSRPFDVETMPPPALGLVDLASYRDTGEGRAPYGLTGPFISVETSRGCAQACTFCATPSTKGRFRFMKLEAIRHHFEYFQSVGVQSLLFQEDNVLSRIHRNPHTGEYAFPDGRSELLEMFRLAREMRFTWEFTNGLEFGRFIENGEIDHELIDALFWHDVRDEKIHGGCYRATIPLENLSEKSSLLFRKLKSIDESAAVIEALAATGIHSLLFNVIVGRPQDDERILRVTYERASQIKALVQAAGTGTRSYFNVYNLSLFPGTVDYRRLKELLAFDLDRDPEVVTFYLGCLKTEFFSPLEITQARGSLSAALNSDDDIDSVDENRLITHPRFDTLFS